jgi:hypothetical protein
MATGFGVVALTVLKKDAIRPALNGLMPDVHSGAEVNIPLFIDKTILPHELVALLGAHTTAKQFFVSWRMPLRFANAY